MFNLPACLWRCGLRLFLAGFSGGLWLVAGFSEVVSMVISVVVFGGLRLVSVWLLAGICAVSVAVSGCSVIVSVLVSVWSLAVSVEVSGCGCSAVDSVVSLAGFWWSLCVLSG